MLENFDYISWKFYTSQLYEFIKYMSLIIWIETLWVEILWNAIMYIYDSDFSIIIIFLNILTATSHLNKNEMLTIIMKNCGTLRLMIYRTFKLMICGAIICSLRAIILDTSKLFWNTFYLVSYIFYRKLVPL